MALNSLMSGYQVVHWTPRVLMKPTLSSLLSLLWIMKTNGAQWYIAVAPNMLFMHEHETNMKLKRRILKPYCNFSNLFMILELRTHLSIRGAQFKKFFNMMINMMIYLNSKVKNTHVCRGHYTQNRLPTTDPHIIHANPFEKMKWNVYVFHIV